MPINKEKLYGCFNKSAKRMEDLRVEAARKHLDLPAESEELNVHNQSGVSGISLVTIAAIALIGWLIFHLFDGQVRPGVNQAVQQAPLEAQEYDVEFWFDEDTQIEVTEQ